MAKKCAVGHKGCTCPMMCCSVTADRGAQIAQDARSGRNWAEEKNAGPGCICGAGLRTGVAARAFQGVHGKPAGQCACHPGGTIRRESDGPQEDGIQA